MTEGNDSCHRPFSNQIFKRRTSTNRTKQLSVLHLDNRRAIFMQSIKRVSLIKNLQSLHECH